MSGRCLSKDLDEVAKSERNTKCSGDLTDSGRVDRRLPINKLPPCSLRDELNPLCFES